MLTLNLSCSADGEYGSLAFAGRATKIDLLAGCDFLIIEHYACPASATGPNEASVQAGRSSITSIRSFDFVEVPLVVHSL
jgi:hypothetical protein